MGRFVEKELGDGDPMPFGKHAGVRMDQVPDHWMFWYWSKAGGENKFECPVAGYIRRNLAAFEKDYPDGIWR
jgi:hypothetical protein